MRLNLSKTLLSTKPTEQSFLLAIVCFMTLVFIHSLDTKGWMASADLVFNQGQYWKLFTSSLVHSDMSHLGHNVLFFSGFAMLLNNYFGWFIFPVISLFMGAVINWVTLKFYGPQIYLVGISGVIYFMLALWMILYILIHRSISLKRRLINAIAVSLILFFPKGVELNVSYLAHAVGFGFGVITGLGYFVLNMKKIRSREVWEEIIEEEPLTEEWNEAIENDGQVT